MSPPYTVKEAASVSGLSRKYIYRLKEGLPHLFEMHTTRGKANKMLLSEELIQVLRGVGTLKDKGKSLHEIVRAISGEGQNIFEITKSGLSKLKGETALDMASTKDKTSLDGPVQTDVQTVQTRGKLLSKLSKLGRKRGGVVQGFKAYKREEFSLDNDEFHPVQTDVQTVQTKEDDSKLERQFRQEILFLQNEVQFLKETLRRTEERFDRLLPATREWGSPTPVVSRKNWRHILLESIATGLIALAAGTILLLLSQQILFTP